MLHICCIINDTRLRGGTIDVGMGHQPEKKMGPTKVDEEAKKNGVGQLRLLFSCCLSLSFYAKKEERTEHSRRSRKEEPLLQSCEP